MLRSVAYLVTHTEYERGWGRRPDGYSLHRTMAEAKAYIADLTAIWAGRGPHEFPSYSGPQLVVISEDIAFLLGSMDEGQGVFLRGYSVDEEGVLNILD